MQKAAERLAEHACVPPSLRKKRLWNSCSGRWMNWTMRCAMRARNWRRRSLRWTRFKSMLARQRQIRDDVSALHEKAPRGWQRPDQLKLSETAQTQRAVAADCAEVARILVSEGTTVLLPELTGDLARNMEDIADRLDQSDTGVQTQRRIAEVLAALEEVVGAIEVRRKQELQNMLQPPDQGGQSGRQALLPESVELMLLRSAQMRINQRTADLSADSAASPEAAAELARLAARQQRLVEIARQMNERK